MQTRLRNGVDPGWVTLHDAARNRNVDALKLILAVDGVDVNAKDTGGWTALHVAASKGQVDALTVLLAVNDADVNAKQKDGYTPINVAAQHGQVGALKVLLATDSIDADAKDNLGWVALHSAAWNGYAEAVKVLLAVNDGAHVNAKDSAGRTPIRLAAEGGHMDALSSLLAAPDIDVNAKQEHGYTPLDIAAQCGQVGSLKVLLATNSIDVDAKDDLGWVALHSAALNGHAEAVKVLLAVNDGAHVNAATNDGRTPIHLAAAEGHVDALKALLSVDSAASNGEVEAVAVHGILVNAKDNNSKTPAVLAAENGHLEALKVLMGNGADVNTTVATAAKGDCAAFLADVALQTPQSLRKELYTTQADLDTSKRLVETVTQQLEEATSIAQQAEGAAEASLLALLQEASNVMGGPDGWASPQRADPANEARRAIDVFVTAREALSTSLASAAESALDPSVIARHRADCCAAATVLLEQLPLANEDTGIPAAAARPPAAHITEVAEAVSAATRAHTSALDSLKGLLSASSDRVTIAEFMRAAMAANAACAPHVEVVQAKLSAARAAIAPTTAITAEECDRQRATAEAVLEAEGPWAGDAGLQRRQAALVGLSELVARRAAAQRAFSRKDKVLAAAKAALAVFSDNDSAEDSDDDDCGVEAARAAHRKAEAERAAALPAMLTATAAVQEWATSGEGALALKAFPGDAELTAALAELFEAEFTAHTELPRTPGVRLEVEYPAGLVESPATLVFHADRVSGDRSVPVVLRRLRLSSPGLVEEAQRQVRDAGRIAVGLQSCPDAAARAPPVVKATRWFLATGPGGGTADAWLEFPRAEFGSLAETLATTQCAFSATTAAGLCIRLARAVAQLHAAGIRHGDLNPSNVVLWDDPASDVVRPGIIDLLDTAVVGATRTLRGATLEWLPPEAAEAVVSGTKAYGTRELDCWQLGRICEAVLGAAAALPEKLLPVRAAAAALCAAKPAERSTVATALLAMEAAVAGASATAMATSASVQWALPPAQWLCQRGAAPGVDFVALDVATDPAASALAACAGGVGRRVRAVHRLENLRLWRVYAAERARVAEEAQGAQWPPRLVSEAAQTFSSAAAHDRDALLTDGSPGEAWLLHGSPPQSHRLIAEGGLDPSYSGGRVGALFGAATCLTPSWTKAANEYARGAGAGVFVTRAAVGCVADCVATPGHETREYRRPPDGHHCVLGDNNTPGAVVAVYRPSRMYPEYLVVFDD